MQKPKLQARLLLGVPRLLAAARLLLVQLQSLRRGGGPGGTRRPRETALVAVALPPLLQSLHESHAVAQVRAQTVRVDQGENGGDAAAQHVLDRGAVPEEGRRHSVPVPTNADVHLRVCVLPAQEQSVANLRGQPERPGDIDGEAVRVSGARYYQREFGRHQAEGAGQISVSWRFYSIL